MILVPSRELDTTIRSLFEIIIPLEQSKSLAAIGLLIATLTIAQASGGFAAARHVPERKDDLAFESDKVAFRIYGPALKDSTERSGIDCWLKRVDLSDTDEYGNRDIRIPIDLANRNWVRIEVWDIARNGAFTRPVWIE